MSVTITKTITLTIDNLADAIEVMTADEQADLLSQVAARMARWGARPAPRGTMQPEPDAGLRQQRAIGLALAGPSGQGALDMLDEIATAARGTAPHIGPGQSPPEVTGESITARQIRELVLELVESAAPLDDGVIEELRRALGIGVEPGSAEHHEARAMAAIAWRAKWIRLAGRRRADVVAELPAPEAVRPPTWCRSCPHPPHVGLCTRRNGGTAYACGCPVDTHTAPEPAAAPVCSTCSDTHQMPLGEDGDRRLVMCTRCPTPCQRCRAGGNGPYCERTPCPCECHRKAGSP